MPRYAALLRGINVGGRNKVAMADLRELASALGHADVATYIQSGNLVFSSAEPDPAALADELEREIAGRLGVQPAVVVISAPELAAVIAANPFPDETNPRCLHVIFRRDEVDAAGIRAVAAAVEKFRAAGGQDDAAARGRVVYLRTPGGLGRSDLAAVLSRPAAAIGGTARNWATVGKLMAMLDGAS